MCGLYVDWVVMKKGMDNMNYKKYLNKIMFSLKNYIKAKLILSFITFLILCIGLKLIRIDFWFIKAFIISIIDFLPFFGIGIIVIPWAIIKALTGSVNTGIQLAILYLALSVIKFVLEPIIIGKNVGLPPLMTILVTLISVLIFGPIGAILAGFFTVIIKVVWDLYRKKKS